MTINIKQTDPRWSSVLIGDSPCSVGRWGCTISSACMALGDFHERFVNPADAARYWTFTSNGEIIWVKTHFNGMRFMHRYYGHDSDVIKEHVRHLGKAVIAQVNGNHWIYIKAIAKGGSYVVIDPIDGLEHQKLPTKYTITGFATFERTMMDEEPVPTWAEKDWKKCQKDGLLDGTRPNDPFTRAEASVVIQRLIKIFNK